MLEQVSLVLALILQAKAGTAYPFESAGSCAKCHSAIYSEWRNTMHAQSYTDPVFQVAYHQVAAKADRKVCLECHAPLARHAKDPDLDHAITREGITCDFCHTVSDLQEGGSPPAGGSARWRDAAGGHPEGTDGNGQGTSQPSGAADLSGDTSSGLYVVEPGHVMSARICHADVTGVADRSDPCPEKCSGPVSRYGVNSGAPSKAPGRRAGWTPPLRDISEH